MCGGVEFEHEGQAIRCYFPDPNAKLPVKLKNGDSELIAWGQRQQQPGNFPPGGWARLESIRNGLWDKYHPVPVKIHVQRYMEKDQNRKSHWFDLPQDQFIQGLVIQKDQDQRVYVVTVASEPEQIHDRWPRILEYGQSYRPPSTPEK